MLPPKLSSESVVGADALGGAAAASNPGQSMLDEIFESLRRERAEQQLLQRDEDRRQQAAEAVGTKKVIKVANSTSLAEDPMAYRRRLKAMREQAGGGSTTVASTNQKPDGAGEATDDGVLPASTVHARLAAPAAIWGSHAKPANGLPLPPVTSSLPAVSGPAQTPIRLSSASESSVSVTVAGVASSDAQGLPALAPGGSGGPGRSDSMRSRRRNDRNGDSASDQQRSGRRSSRDRSPGAGSPVATTSLPMAPAGSQAQLLASVRRDVAAAGTPSVAP